MSAKVEPAIEPSIEKSPYYQLTPTATWTLRALFLIGVAGVILGGLGLGGIGISDIDALGSGLIALGGGLLVLFTALCLYKKRALQNPKTAGQVMEECLSVAERVAATRQKRFPGDFTALKVDGITIESHLHHNVAKGNCGHTTVFESGHPSSCCTGSKATRNDLAYELWGIFEGKARRVGGENWFKLMNQNLERTGVTDEAAAHAFTSASSGLKALMKPKDNQRSLNGAMASCILMTEETIYVANIGSIRTLLVRRQSNPLSLSFPTHDALHFGSDADFDITKIQKGTHYQAGDYLVMATEELWNFATDQEVADLVNGWATRQKPLTPLEMAGDLVIQLKVATQQERGPMKNATVMVMAL